MIAAPVLGVLLAALTLALAAAVAMALALANHTSRQCFLPFALALALALGLAPTLVLLPFLHHPPLFCCPSFCSLFRLLRISLIGIIILGIIVTFPFLALALTLFLLRPHPKVLGSEGLMLLVVFLFWLVLELV